MSEQWHIRWIDRYREPQGAPNPAYPTGIDVDVSAGALNRCQTALPYPARRCGSYSIRCRLCGFTGLITTAGRPDDPRSITVPCLPREDTPSDTAR